MQKVPLSDKWARWDMWTVQLLRLPNPEGREEWVYIVRFSAVHKRRMVNGPPSMDVPVRMDGTIPKPVVKKKSYKSVEPTLRLAVPWLTSGVWLAVVSQCQSFAGTSHQMTH